MQTRHRIPTIFNLSMVDVLCCALGCIILLWLVYFKEARERAATAGKTNKELVATKFQLDKVSRELTSTQQILLASKQKHDYLNTQFVEATAQRDQFQFKYHQADTAYTTTLMQLKGAEAKVAGLQTD